MIDIFPENGTRVVEYFNEALEKAEFELVSLDKDLVLNESAEKIADILCDECWPHPIMEDQKNPISAFQTSETFIDENSRGDRFVLEKVTTTVTLSLQPAKSNAQALTLIAGSTEWPHQWPFRAGLATFDEDSQQITLKIPSQSEHIYVPVIKHMIALVNLQLEDYKPQWLSFLLQKVRQRKIQVGQQTTEFQLALNKLGIKLIQKPGAVLPIDITHKVTKLDFLKQSYKANREEMFLAPDSVKQLVGLIDRLGRNFEVAPATYNKLREEDLRNIIIAYLNTFFETTAASGETFSKKGKTDIFLNIDDRPSLIAECKFWDGQKLYVDTFSQQLFGYLTWRHTTGVMITFSEKKGLSKVINEVDAVIQNHQTFKGRFEIVSDTYRISEHIHPDDEEKLVELHHLFFNLYAN